MFPFLLFPQFTQSTDNKAAWRLSLQPGTEGESSPKVKVTGSNPQSDAEKKND